MQTNIVLVNFSYNADFVNVYDGNSTSSNVIRHMSGTWGNNVNSTIISTGSDMFINFISDDWDYRNGFRIQYTTYGK